MNDPFQMQRELRYGAPVCDQILTGRHFTIGYSWYFRQAKWVLEIINPLERLLGLEFEDGDRLDNFRADQRIPWRFRASLGAYKNSGFDRGHLSPSANLRETQTCRLNGQNLIGKFGESLRKLSGTWIAKTT